MHCKPGDIAIIIESSNPNYGRLVSCLRIVDAKPQHEAWLTEGLQRMFDLSTGRMVPAGSEGIILDRLIKPLPSQDDVLEFDRTRTSTILLAALPPIKSSVTL